MQVNQNIWNLAFLSASITHSKLMPLHTTVRYRYAILYMYVRSMSEYNNPIEISILPKAASLKRWVTTKKHIDGLVELGFFKYSIMNGILYPFDINPLKEEIDAKINQFRFDPEKQNMFDHE